MSNTFKIETNISVRTRTEVYRLPETRESSSTAHSDILWQFASPQGDRTILFNVISNKKKRLYIHDHAVADAFYPVD